MGDSKSAMVAGAMLFTLCSLLLTPCSAVDAQQPAKLYVIGFLAAVSPAALSDRTEAFRRGLGELGYVEGKNIIIESRYAEGRLERLPALAAEMIRLKVNVIVTAGPQVTRRVKEATVPIPIVMAKDSDPVDNRNKTLLVVINGCSRSLSLFRLFSCSIRIPRSKICIT